jgi:hypothetical protein
MGAASGVNIPENSRQPFDRFNRGIIVWVNAEEEVEITISDGRQIVADHTLDNSRFLPTRHEDGDVPFFANGHGDEGGIFSATTPEEVPQTYEGGDEVIQAACNQAGGEDGEQVRPDDRKRERSHLFPGEAQRGQPRQTRPAHVPQ